MNNTSLAATAPNVIVNDSCEIELESAAERVVNIVGYSVIIPVSIIGNTLLICAVKQNNRLNTITYRLIINMAGHRYTRYGL